VSYPIDRAVPDLRLSRDLQHGSQPAEPSAAAMAAMEAGFDERVQYMAALDSEYCRVLQSMQKLERIAASESDILSNVLKSAKECIHST
jgi:hypothetical protein